MKPSEIKLLLEMKFKVRNEKGDWIDKETPDYQPDPQVVKGLENEFLKILQDGDGFTRYDHYWINWIHPDKSAAMSNLLKAKKVYHIEFRHEKADYSGWIKGFATTQALNKKKVNGYILKRDGA